MKNLSIPQRGLAAQEMGNISREKLFSTEQYFFIVPYRFVYT
jgi:hypothetical protein